MANCNGAFLCAAMLLQLFHSTMADHPCTAEVASACAERPATDIGACLKDPEEHDEITEVSSGCTDFMALNKACSDDIEQFCDGGQFTDDTIICLTKWAPEDAVSAKCKGVLSWAAPQEDAGDEDVVTDELGLSEEDYKQKKEWQAKRRAARGDAIERMKMKDVDKKKEQDRVDLEEFKKNDPDGYEQMMQQQAEEKRQQADFKKRERAQAAAIERAKKKAAGESEEDEDQSKSRSKDASGKGKAKSKGSWLYSLMSLAVLVLVGAGIWFLVTQMSNKKGGGRNAGGKKKRR